MPFAARFFMNEGHALLLPLSLSRRHDDFRQWPMLRLIADGHARFFRLNMNGEGFEAACVRVVIR